MTEREIENWFDQKWESETYSNGTIVTNCRMLIDAGVRFEDMTIEELSSAIIGLAKNTLRPFATSISGDHIALWEWAYFVISSDEFAGFFDNQKEIKSLLQISLTCGLVAKGQTLDISTNNPVLGNYIRGKDLVLAYTVFPLLEALTKLTASTYLDCTGNVKLSFTVTKANGNIRKHDQNKICSSLCDVLYLCQDIGDSCLQNYLQKFQQNFVENEPTIHLYEKIYEWRNSSLHGESNYPCIGAYLLLLNLLFLLSNAKTLYTNHQEAIKARYEEQQRSAG